MAASVEAAVTARLKADVAVNAAVSGRVFPQLDTQEPTFPQLVYTKIGTDGGARLKGGSGSLKAYTVQVDCYADTEVAAVALGLLVRAALTPGNSPWQDKAAGVHGCFHLDGSAGFTEDGVRFQSETFTVWFRPT